MDANRVPPATTLTGLERELLGYVERLTRTSEDFSARFEVLERRSSALIEQRQSAIEAGMRSLIGSQKLLIAGLNASVAASNRAGSLRPDLAASLQALDQALKAIDVTPT